MPALAAQQRRDRVEQRAPPPSHAYEPASLGNSGAPASTPTRPRRRARPARRWLGLARSVGSWKGLGARNCSEGDVTCAAATGRGEPIGGLHGSSQHPLPEALRAGSAATDATLRRRFPAVRVTPLTTLALLALTAALPGAARAQVGAPDHPDRAPPPPELEVQAPTKQRADPRGPGRAAAARRPLVLPPGRPVRGRGAGLVPPARPGRLEPRAGAEQLERHGPDAEPRHGRLVPQGVHAARGAEGRAALLEGALRGRELPQHRVAERPQARELHRLLPVRARPHRACAAGATRSW